METDICIWNWNVLSVNNFPEMTKKNRLYVRFWILLLFTSCQLDVFSNTRYWFEIEQRFFSNTVNISFAKVVIATEFLLAISEVYSPMASVATFSANTLCQTKHKYSTLKDMLWWITFRDGLPVMSDLESTGVCWLHTCCVNIWWWLN